MIAALFIILAAMMKALADTLAHHFDTSIFKWKDKRFWKPDVSSEWAHKIFSYKVDAWHLSNSAMIVFMIAAITLHRYDKLQLAWYYELVIGGLLWNGIFNTFYNKIFR